MSEKHDLIYDLESKPPFGTALLGAVTHLLAIFVPMVTPALIVGGALGLSVEVTGYLVSMAMVASGVGTYIQVSRFGPVGSGMLSIQSVNFSFVTIMITLGSAMKKEGLDEAAIVSGLLGVAFVGAFLVVAAGWILPSLRKLISSTVSGVVVLMIGLSLVNVGITDFGGGFGAMANGTFGSVENIFIATLVLATVIFFNCMKSEYLRMSGIAIGLTVGYIVSLALGKVDFSPLQGLPLVTIPTPFKYGFSFDFGSFFVTGIIFLLSVLEAVGDLTATAIVSGQPTEGKEFEARLRGGVLADGVVSVIACALGSLPLTTFSQNNGVIQMTGVASRHIGKIIAIILVVLGIFPVVGRAFTTIPSPVLGGAMVIMFGMIAVAGLRIIFSDGVYRREALIVATSVGLGLGVTFRPEVFTQMAALIDNMLIQNALKAVLESPIAMGGLTALLLTSLIPESKEPLNDH
ncbi:MAG: solute carrier family 23 protein [Alcaligenaceae bacterium]|nr:solute carrier family 23 protein [Alcaligenaceae bacterium]